MSKNNFRTSLYGNDDVKEKIVSKNNYGLKKIDFDLLEKNKNDKIYIKNMKTKLLRYFSISIIILLLSIFLLKMNYHIILNIVSYVVIFISGITTALYLFYIIFPKKVINKEFFKNYKNQLPIINLTPTDLNYEVLDMIDIGGYKDYDKARNDLINRAFKIKADAIIQFNHSMQTNSELKGNIKNFQTNIISFHQMQGVAIRLK
ncbi:hypothetical protein [Aliarcobacter butzleri]|uniref:hypothetical protein n=1 Tax=Aliarcobacter butzleri TaxID=28197 RepID=UPI00263F0C51|nr:hypothetical protein [Aliarcobacter butzleri]MDN5095788.1 hypothetical protein [Aliarcobacter butzleri]